MEGYGDLVTPTTGAEPPDARSKVLLGLAHAFERLVLGPLTPRVGTPAEVVFQWEKTTLIRYRSRQDYVHSVPLLVIPPLMVQPWIFDLRPGHSMVETLLARHIDVHLLDLGIPKDEDRDITIDDYVLEFIPNAVDRLLARGHKEVSLLGWSMGGILAILYTALQGRQGPVRNLVALGSPVDFSRMFPFNLLATLAKRMGGYRVIDQLGNVPPFLTRNGFKLMKPIGSLLRYRDLVKNLWDRNWVAGYESIGGWIAGFIPYPGETFKQFASDFVSGDKLRKREVTIGDQTVDLAEIASSVLVFAGTADDIAPVESVGALVDYVSGADKTILKVPLGHIGLVSGSQAPGLVWEPLADWLVPRSGERTTISPASAVHRAARAAARRGTRRVV